MTASWKKTAGVKGYQICYSTSKKWKGKKQKLVSKNKAVIKKLKRERPIISVSGLTIWRGQRKYMGHGAV